jgi:hypothetical protein
MWITASFQGGLHVVHCPRFCRAILFQRRRHGVQSHRPRVEAPCVPAVGMSMFAYVEVDVAPILEFMMSKILCPAGRYGAVRGVFGVGAPGMAP